MADIIYRNGMFVTMSERRPDAQALALRAGRIIAVGSDAEIAGLGRRDTRVVDLQGAVVLPGFHDAHVHLTGYGLELERLDISSAADTAAALELIRAAPGDGLLRGAGFSVATWGADTLTAQALDAVWPERPVIMRSRDLHSAWLNSRALELVGIGPDTPDPAGGRIGRDASGNPSGLLFEAAAQLAQARLPEPSREELDRALAAAARSMAAMGITTVHHMAAEPASMWRALADAASDDTYPLRVWACLPQEDIEAAAGIGIATGQGGANFSIGGAKFFTDGALGSATAWLLEPYEGTDDTGVQMLPQDVLHERIALAVRSGLTPVIHAIGDAAVHESLNALEACRDSISAARLRPRIEHAQHITRADVPRLAELGVIASMQPIHLTFDAIHAGRLLGKRVSQSYPFRQLLNAGTVLAFGSDAPVAPPGVIDGLRAAVSRHGSDGKVFEGQERLTADEALQAYTTGAALAIGAERRSGKLELGYDADLVVLSEDPRSQLEGLSVLQTVKGGMVTYDSGALDDRVGR